MAAYFRAAPPADAAWAVFFLTGRRLKRLIPSAAMRDWTLAATGFEQWLLEECYSVVGDGAETSALMLDAVAPASSRSQDEDVSLAVWVEERILPLKQLDPAAQQARVTRWLLALDRWQRFILLKLLTGELRLGVSQTLVVRALAHAAQLPTTTIAARLMGDWPTTPTGSRAWSPQARPPKIVRGRIRFSSPPRCSRRMPDRTSARPICWATSRTGKSSGSGTASARSS